MYSDFAAIKNKKCKNSAFHATKYQKPFALLCSTNRYFWHNILLYSAGPRTVTFCDFLSNFEKKIPESSHNCYCFWKTKRNSPRSSTVLKTRHYYHRISVTETIFIRHTMQNLTIFLHFLIFFLGQFNQNIFGQQCFGQRFLYTQMLTHSI